jgi:hypothetical protein
LQLSTLKMFFNQFIKRSHELSVGLRWLPRPLDFDLFVNYRESASKACVYHVPPIYESCRWRNLFRWPW